MGAVLREVGYADASRVIVVVSASGTAGRACYLGVVGGTREGLWCEC